MDGAEKYMKKSAQNGNKASSAVQPAEKTLALGRFSVSSKDMPP